MQPRDRNQEQRREHVPQQQIDPGERQIERAESEAGDERAERSVRLQGEASRKRRVRVGGSAVPGRKLPWSGVSFKTLHHNRISRHASRVTSSLRWTRRRLNRLDASRRALRARSSTQPERAQRADRSRRVGRVRLHGAHARRRRAPSSVCSREVRNVAPASLTFDHGTGPAAIRRGGAGRT